MKIIVLCHFNNRKKLSDIYLQGKYSSPKDQCYGSEEIRTMDGVNNNQFEVKPITSKRKITAPCSNVYLNPALDLLANEDRICNTVMEIPVKKRKRTKSLDVVSFENSALDLGVKPVNEVLVREIDNVRRNVKLNDFNNKDENAHVKGVEGKATGVGNDDDTFFQYIDDTTDDVDFIDTVDKSNILNNITNIENSVIKDDDNTASNLITEPVYANLNDLQLISKVSENINLPKTKEICPLPFAETKPKHEDTNANSQLNLTDISRITPEDNCTDSGISVLDQNRNRAAEFSNISNITNIQSNITNQVIVNNSNLSLSFIDRLALDSPNSDRSLYLDDDLNESNIMEIKTITIITKKKRIVEKKNTNPFLNPNLDTNIEIPMNNPFLDMKPEIEYQEEVLNRQEETAVSNNNALMPRRLFTDNTNSTISTVNETTIESNHDYENIDILPDPIYENIDELNKQSKILGHDVSHFSNRDIMNLKKSKADNSNDSNDSKKEKHSFFKAGKLSKKVFKTLKKTFKHEKSDNNLTVNPYEVPRKPPKQKTADKESGIENPALNLDNSDDLEFEELSDDEEHQYETIKTMRNTRLNMNVTPLRERNEDVDLSNRVTTPGKKVRFDSTLNQEKVITGNSFDYSMASPGFDAKIDKYHDELENCINERKFLQQNM